jgi:nucleotidyltransferase AbiEii toxin of type IV toxin-antitoxin system
MDLYDELTQLIAAFDAAGVEYAVCGALALAIHGIPRATKDIDVLVPSASLDRLREAARSCGYTIEALPMTFSTSGITVHRFTKLLGPRHVMLDALIADGPLANVWSSRQSLGFSAGTVSVVSREGLVTLKLAAGRPQDLVDVQRLKELDDADG